MPWLCYADCRATTNVPGLDKLASTLCPLIDFPWAEADGSNFNFALSFYRRALTNVRNVIWVGTDALIFVRMNVISHVKI